MNLFEILKQFKNIEPDRAFAETSKRAIFAMTPQEPAASFWTARRTFFRIVETGIAVALAGFFVLLLTGGLGGTTFAPVQYSAIDPQGLRAEAQAIDMQIELANVNYSSPSAVSTLPLLGKAQTTIPLAGTASGTLGVAATSSTTTTLSIDEALKGLAN
jgi:hypothetical protein